jgi:hypothetical protein
MKRPVKKASAIISRRFIALQLTAAHRAGSRYPPSERRYNCSDSDIDVPYLG